MRSDATAQALLADRRLLREVAQRLRSEAGAQRRRQTGRLRTVLLRVASLPLLPASLVHLATGDLIGFVAAAGAFASIQAGASLHRRAMLEQAMARHRRFHRHPAMFTGNLAYLAVGGGTALAAFAAAGHGAAASLVFGGLAAGGLFAAAHRPGAPRAPAPPLPADATLARSLRRAEQRIQSIDETAATIGNAELGARLQRIAAGARDVLDQVAANPGQWRRARRFFHVHLEGAERVAARYARSHRWVQGMTLEAELRTALVEIEASVQRLRQRLRDDDLDELDVQIAVLRKQIQAENTS